MYSSLGYMNKELINNTYMVREIYFIFLLEKDYVRENAKFIYNAQNPHSNMKGLHKVIH